MALTTLDEVKLYLKIDTTVMVDDERLEGLINACSKAIENFCRRSFGMSTYTNEEYDGNGSRYINLLNYPVQSVSSVTVNDIVIEPDQYTIKKRSGILVRKGSAWTKGDVNVLVTYSAGYSTIPPDLELACKLFVASFYRADVQAFSTTFTDGFVFKADSMPVQVKMMLQPYMAVL